MLIYLLSELLYLFLVVSCNTFVACVPCCIVYRLWGLGLGYHVVVLCNTDLWYDKTVGRDTNLVFVLSIAINSVLQEPSIGNY